MAEADGRGFKETSLYHLVKAPRLSQYPHLRAEAAAFPERRALNDVEDAFERPQIIEPEGQILGRLVVDLEFDDAHLVVKDGGSRGWRLVEQNDPETVADARQRPCAEAGS